MSGAYGTANFNEELGLPYGVLAANSGSERVRWLAQEIWECGDDLEYQRFVEALRQNFRDALSEFDLDGDSNLIERLVDTVTDRAPYESNEAPYFYGDDDGKYLIQYLGGAPLIWVLESKWRARCSPCSLCVPGAGDLDSPDDENGMWALSLDTETMREIDPGYIVETIIDTPAE